MRDGPFHPMSGTSIARPVRPVLGAVLLSLLLLLLAHPAQARDALPFGVPVGTALPHDLAVPDQSNQVQSFVTLKKNRGLILIFSRSLSW